ncbi:DUF6642 family protein [Nonlabens ponticola]|uniref:Uncharacterized protein n=1 Tax=Nonlabens ponticola TaxID=2496866 RepID=A0A3S9MUH8_9FLAO|nr:DUF6642 family protein [Nonlabens ponticola]AZQ42834.1 hypothetical protein EJ995_00750 [Nonlabens ponticola]
MSQLEVPITDVETFIYCLEVVPDVDVVQTTEVTSILEDIARNQHITSIYKACDTIEGLEEAINQLIYDDHHFKDYEIIYLVLPGDANNILINGYYYSIEEIAELFEGKLDGKILHFANKKVLDLTDEESQYFMDITGARAVSGYGFKSDNLTSAFTIDRVFFSLFYEDDDIKAVVERMFRKHYKLCTLLDFRLYY